MLSPDQKSKQQLLSVMQWNVLARPYTKYMTSLHRSGCTVETLEQTHARYTSASATILERMPDIVCLQEVEENFFEADWNTHASVLLENYNTYKKILQGSGGTTVLVSKSCPFQVCGETKVGGERATGGSSKSTVCVRLKNSGGDAVVVLSSHLSFKPAQRQEHMEHLQTALGVNDGYERVVFCGDFNTCPEDLPEFVTNSFFANRNMTLVAPENYALTGCGTNNSQPRKCIDYIYVSGLNVVEGSVEVGGEPRFPYAHEKEEVSPAEVVTPSDHCWLSIRLTF